jgi:mevalonate kinase
LKNHIFSPGKLLITSEYFVLDGALALAVPTRLGQDFYSEEEKEDNICAPTDFNPANGAPMIGCLDIYGNPYGVSGAEDNHNDYTYDDNSYN